MPTRAHGRRGVRRESHAPHLQLSQFRTTAPSAPPPSGDVTMGLEQWGMLGNDELSDCGAAAFEHGRMAKALEAVTDGTPTFEAGFAHPTTSRTRFLYFAYGVAMGEPGPEPDEGVENATWLQYLYEQGIVEWYGELDKSNPDEVHQAMLGCRGVLVAVALPSDAETQFDAHQPWKLDGAGTEGGHDVLLVRYRPTGETFVTWGTLQDATVTWDAACILEAWAFGTREDAARAGYTFDAIVAAIEGAGGSVTGS